LYILPLQIQIRVDKILPQLLDISIVNMETVLAFKGLKRKGLRNTLLAGAFEDTVVKVTIIYL
jgi:hypothetical protein